jgi:micrococcal nuclease
MDYKSFIKTHQQTIVLTIGYVLIALLGFGLGRFTSPNLSVPEVRVEEAFTPPANYTPNIAGIQTIAPQTGLNCEGKIKGSSSLIYHLPGGSFYDRTTHPIRCFNSEAEAQAAGFRKSSK